MSNQDNKTTTLPAMPPQLSLRDRIIVYGGVFLVSAMGWAYMFYMGWAMENMHLVDMWMPPQGGTRSWGLHDFWMLFIMWAVMMVAMMTP